MEIKFDFSIPDLQNMQDDTIETMSTSQVTGDASPVLLKETDSIRLRFCPKIVKSDNRSEKTVSGKLIHEKKSKKESSFPTDGKADQERISRGSLKIGDWMELELNTNETLALYKGLTELYTLSGQIDSISPGYTKYIKMGYKDNYLLKIIKTDPSFIRTISEPENYETVKMLFQTLTENDSKKSLSYTLKSLKDINLQNLFLSIHIEKLQRVSKLMKDNLNNYNEEFWQTEVFTENQWILSQIFSYPHILYKDKAYIGGKTLDNSNGNICDFIYKNTLSQNVALIEIKTPCTRIIASNYRNTYSFSTDLTGSINQVLTYRDNIIKNYYSLSRENKEYFEVFNPQCIVVIGKIGSLSKEETAAFENFRNSLSNITVITFDELYDRINNQIGFLSNAETTL